MLRHQAFDLSHYLLQDGLLDTETQNAARLAAQEQNMPLTNYLVKFNLLSSQALLAYCRKKFDLPVFDLSHYDFSWLEQANIPFDILCRYHVIPLNRDQHHLYLGVADPTDDASITAIGFHTGLHIRPMLVSEAELDKIIEHACRPNRLNSQLESTLSKMPPLENLPALDEHQEHNDEPVIAFVDQLLHDAMDKKISDIHIEPYQDYCRIRFRRDGLLYEAATLPKHLSMRVTTRLKIMANLDIAERRLPQDGRIQLRHGTKIDIRINSCPTLFGEKLVLRLLNALSTDLAIEALGFMDSQQTLFLQQLVQPQGLILVTGPTGSGKTMTLYSALHYLNQIEKNISCVEDPVEIELTGINQVSINPKIGLDFCTVLRTFLRQDPDIIMVGEIRDQDTAEIAIQAAQTGHLVIATMHTNNAVEAITRLQSLRVTTYNIIHSVSFIIAQRLVRKLCSHCKQLDRQASNLQYFALGCEHCYQGYQGRIGIFECLPMTEIFTELLLSKVAHAMIVEKIKHNGWPLLWEAGLDKVKRGITSYNELMRVLGNHLSCQTNLC